LEQSFPCPKCGAQIAVGQYYCSGCGQRFEYRCRHCGTAVSDSSGFCANCGGKLSHVPQHPRPAKKVEPTYYRQETSSQRPVVHVSRYIIVVAIICFLVGIIYWIGSSSQGNSSNLPSGYSFGGQSPPTAPPPSVPNTSVHQEQPAPKKADSPTFTASEVIAEAIKFSPDCHVLIQRTG
jgi:hypothetical protein